MTENESPTQLTLLPSDTPLRSADKVPVQFRLDEATRRRGLQHVAELRRLLATRQAAKSAASSTSSTTSTTSTASTRSITSRPRADRQASPSRAA